MARIGVFDSGVGGLTVLRALRERLPAAEYLYFGDTARLPYGSKSVATVARYAIGAARFLEQRGIDHLVIACNTACALAFDRIREAVRVPVTGVIEPGAQAAMAKTTAKEVTVIATEGTVQSHAYQQRLAALGITAHEQACPLFVPLVEEGWWDHPVTEQVAKIYLQGCRERKADVLLLGCTHYPLLTPLLRRVLPERIAIVDSAASTAAQVQAELASAAGAASLRFFATDSVEKFRRAGEKFLGGEIANVEHIDMEG